MAISVTLWMTGLSGSGKSTISDALAAELRSRKKPFVQLDGDVLRKGLCKDLGFDAASRAENIRRVAEVAKLFNQCGITVIVSLISPMREDRAQAKEIIGESHFVEVYVSTPLGECERRDVKGLYAKARSGVIPNFTGVSAPYEPPDDPDIRLDTTELELDEEVAVLMEVVR